jgi:hypothetical protein
MIANRRNRKDGTNRMTSGVVFLALCALTFATIEASAQQPAADAAGSGDTIFISLEPSLE